jgi:hypothetical protein
MSAVPLVRANGTVEIVDFAFPIGEAAEKFEAYRSAREIADDDYAAGRLYHHSMFTEPDANRAAEELAEVCGISFASLDDFEAFIIRCTNAARDARQAIAEGQVA